MNVAPIALSQADKDNRAQRLALQIGALRVLIRHRHAHSGSAAARQEYNDALSSDEFGSLTIDIGDFNEHPMSAFNDDGCVLFPSEKTYRLNTADEQFITCIDGCIVSQYLASSASVTALEPVKKVQHRPVLIQLGFNPDFHNSYRWSLSQPVQMGAWEQSTVADFDRAIISDIDEA